MQTDIKQINQTTLEVSITVEAEKAGEAYQKFLQKSAKRFDVPGFRKGKAPLAMVQRLHGERIRGLFEEDYAIDVFNEAAKEHQLSYLMNPMVKSLEWPEDGEFKVAFELEQEPKIEFASLEGLKVPFKPMLLEEQVDSFIEKLTQQNGSIQDVETAEEGDIVGGDLSYEDEGENKTAKVNIKAFKDEKGMYAKLLGAKTADKIELELSGEEMLRLVDYDVTEDFEISEERIYPCTLEVNAVTRLVYPKVDDEFAKDLDFENLAEMKAKISEDMKEKVEHYNIKGQHSAILAKLYKDNPFELPRRTVSYMVEQELEQYSPEYHQMLQELVVQKTVTEMINFYLLNTLMSNSELEPTDEMVDIFMKHNAVMEEMSPGAFREKHFKDEVSEHFKQDALAHHILQEIAAKNEFVEPEPEPEEPEAADAEKTEEPKEEEQ